jgi:hypothetical protein
MDRKSLVLLSERIVNRNIWLYGPGPVERTPTGAFSYYANQDPKWGFSIAAIHGMIIGVGASLAFKYFVGDPQIRAIEEYYRENPPR